jgi:hypothetical protein
MCDNRLTGDFEERFWPLLGQRRIRLARPPARTAIGGGGIADRPPLFVDRCNELGHLRLPRTVCERVLPARRLGRTHPGQHAVEGQAFDPIGAAKSTNLELVIAAIDLKREQVLPFGPSRVQPCDPPFGPGQSEKQLSSTSTFQ